MLSLSVNHLLSLNPYHTIIQTSPLCRLKCFTSLAKFDNNGLLNARWCVQKTGNIYSPWLLDSRLPVTWCRWPRVGTPWSETNKHCARNTSEIAETSSFLTNTGSWVSVNMCGLAVTSTVSLIIHRECYIANVATITLGWFTRFVV